MEHDPGQFGAEVTDSCFLVNFKNTRVLRVFYRTCGVLAWDNCDLGLKHPLSRPADPRYVQTDPVWSRGVSGRRSDRILVEASTNQTDSERFQDI